MSGSDRRTDGQSRVAAIYARVSTERQRQEQTIASQTAALRELAEQRGLVVPEELVFEDDGFSGASLQRPGARAASRPGVRRVLRGACCVMRRTGSRAATPTRCCCSRSSRAAGSRSCSPKEPERSGSPEDELLRQFQGMIAEYERAQIAERCRRGKLHRARAGAVSVLVQRALRLPVCQADRARRRVLRDRRARSADRAGDLRPLRRAARVDRPDRPVAQRAGRADPNRNAALGIVDDLGDPAQPGLHRSGGLRSPARDRRAREADALDPPARQAFRSLRLRARRARALAADPGAGADQRRAARARSGAA